GLAVLEARARVAVLEAVVALLDVRLDDTVAADGVLAGGIGARVVRVLVPVVALLDADLDDAVAARRLLALRGAGVRVDEVPVVALFALRAAVLVPDLAVPADRALALLRARVVV